MLKPNTLTPWTTATARLMYKRDWTISRVLDHAQLVEKIKCELDGFLTSSLVVVNQTAHVFARLLASNAMARLEGILDSLVLIRSQLIEGAELLEGDCAELVQRAAEDTQKSLLLFNVAVGHAGKPKGPGTSRKSSPLYEETVLRRSQVGLLLSPDF